MSYVLVDTNEKLVEMLRDLRVVPDVVYADIETTGLDWFVNDILLFQIKVGNSIYVVDVRELGYGRFTELVSSIGNRSRVVFHNGKFDLKFIYHRTGILLENMYDTMTAEVVLNSGIGKQFYGLAELAEKYADIFMDKDTRMEFVDYPKDKPFTDKQFAYSALDVKVLEPIYHAQIKQFEQTNQIQIADLESNLLPIVAKMEYDGISLDTKMWLDIEKEAILKRDVLTKDFEETILDFLVSLKYPNALELVRATHLLQKNKFSKRICTFLEEITDFSIFRGWLKEHLNVKSSHQLLAIFNLMGIDCPSTNEKVLDDYKEFPIVEKLIEIRGINKQIDQYGSNFLKAIHTETGKIHTEYLTVGTQTGRFSSNKPNLQNVPRDGGYRECFIPEEGYVFAAVDYSQQEYRLAGAVSREPVIIDAYKSGSDMHTATTKIVLKKDEITSKERNTGKTVNFAILYGSTEWGLKKNLGIKVEEAKRIITDFWKGYPNLQKFMDRAGERILELGYSVTPMKRRRYNVPRPLLGNSRDYVMWRERVLREGKNHIIQGGGADIIKLAMVEIYRRNPFGDKLKLCLQIHDEIVTQVHRSVKEEAKEFIIAVMEEVEQRFLGEIPAKADGKLLERWSK